MKTGAETLQLALSEYPAAQLALKQKTLMEAAMEITKSDEMPLKIFNVYNDNLHSAISDEDLERGKLFKNNLSRLAAAKTNLITRELQAAKWDKNGVERPEKEYKQSSKKIINKYNRYQAAEYNTAVHRCRVAVQWDQFQKTKGIYQNIEWIRTRSASPRELHLSYAGRIWPMTSSFWLYNQPGCLYNCKCSWRVTADPATDNTDVTLIPAAPGLKGNPAVTNEIFSQNHPYFAQVEKHIPGLGVLNNPDEIVYLTNKDSKGRKYLEHYLCKFEEETIANRKFVEILIDLDFKDIELLPRIHSKSSQLRERYYGKSFCEKQKSKCPDCKASEGLIEFKEVLSTDNSFKRQLNDAIADAASKSEIIVLKIKKQLSEDHINNIKNNCLKKFPDIKKIIIVNNK